MSPLPTRHRYPLGKQNPGGASAPPGFSAQAATRGGLVIEDAAGRGMGHPKKGDFSTIYQGICRNRHRTPGYDYGPHPSLGPRPTDSRKCRPGDAQEPFMELRPLLSQPRRATPPRRRSPTRVSAGKTRLFSSTHGGLLLRRPGTAIWLRLHKKRRRPPRGAVSRSLGLYLPQNPRDAASVVRAGSETLARQGAFFVRTEHSTLPCRLYAKYGTRFVGPFYGIKGSAHDFRYGRVVRYPSLRDRKRACFQLGPVRKATPR